jgi:hypothetical protein
MLCPGDSLARSACRSRLHRLEIPGGDNAPEPK